MSKYSQQVGINAARNHIDDQYDSKRIFRFSPLQGIVDGSNVIFQIPQTRLVIANYNGVSMFPQVYKNNQALVFGPVPPGITTGIDYVVPDPKGGTIQFAPGSTPVIGDSVDVTFNYVWMDDVEWDRHLNRAANEIGFTVYYTSSSSIANAESLPANGSLPSDIPDGLFNAICLLGASFVAKALSTRFATRYDTSAGDQSFSPSQMSKAFGEMAKDFEKRAYTARDDFYKGQGRQYKPATAQVGYVLPEVTPQR